MTKQLFERFAPDHPTKLEVVIWKRRSKPGRREFAPNLKSGILARGRIRLPLARAQWLIELQKGSSVVECLRPHLDRLAPEVDVTVELFQLLDTKLDFAAHVRVLDAYLRRRHQLHLKHKKLFFGYVQPDDKKAELEGRLGVRLDPLYGRPRVSPPGPQRRGDTRYLLCTYVSLHDEVAQLAVCPPKVAPVRSPPPPLEPLLAMTSGCRNLRNAAGGAGAVLGANRGEPQPVSLVAKQKVGDARWYELSLPEELVLTAPNAGTRCDASESGTVKLAKGSRAWVQGFEWNQPGFVASTVFDVQSTYALTGVQAASASWAYLITQLRDFEKANATMRLTDKISTLRRMGQSRELPFDAVIGRTAPKGAKFLEHHTFDKDRWELLVDYQAVRTPAGETIDFWHLLVGLDVLTRRIESHAFSTIPIGSNYSAATWSGDIGAGAADAQINQDASWHRMNPSATSEKQLRHYFDTRASMADLLADLDAWGVHAIRTSEQQSLADLLEQYYDTLTEGGWGPVPEGRRRALDDFLHDYGFSYRLDRDYPQWPDALWKQARGQRRIVAEIAAFARVWIWFRRPFKPTTVDPGITATMARWFTTWLEEQAIVNGVGAT